MSVLVVPFQQQHYPSARALWERTPGVGLSDADEPEAIARFLQRNPGLSFVAIVEPEIVGTVLCGHDGRRGLIHHLVVAPEHRRKGVGRELLNVGLSGLRRHGIQKCHLLVFGNNEGGLTFWRAAGAAERTELRLFSVSTSSAA